MGRKLICLIILVFAPVAGAQTMVEYFSDDFETPHDYITEGAAGTGWDDYFGRLPGETVDALNASIDPAHPGQLYIASTGGYWHEPWDVLGPFLYKYVEGDFIASVEVTDYAGTPDEILYHNDGGLMARASLADPYDEAGEGEDWVSIDYFPIWTCGNFVWVADEDYRTEQCHNGAEWDLDPWLQIERSGNTFHFRTGTDGISWTEMSCSPVTRDDFEGIPLQVGLRHATYSEDQGYVAFDNFSIVLVRRFKAYTPTPTDGATNIDPNQDLSWSSGVKAEFHDIYLGTNYEDVSNADTSTTGIYKGRQNEASFEPGPMELGQTYYWRVDEVNDAEEGSPWKGPVWSFRVLAWTATDPYPADGADCVTLDTVLTWAAGAQAETHRVYFGITENPPFKGLRNDTTYTPPVLEPDTQYYWRIDERKGTQAWPGDLWTFKTVPAVEISDPNLLGWWKLDQICEGTLILDSSGHGRHGTLKGDPQWIEGHDGDALAFDGRDDYVELPIGSVIGSLTSSTFMIWADYSRAGGPDQQIFDFGIDPNVYMSLTPRTYYHGPLTFVISTEGVNAEYLVEAPSTLDRGWHHVAVTIDAETGSVVLYLDGVEVGRNTISITPSDLGETTNNWLGKPHDGEYAYYLGSLDDFRIYDCVLSQAEISKAMRGDPLLAWNPVPEDGSMPDVLNISQLSWSPGDNAVQHDVYFGTDADAVEQADASDTTNIYRGRQDPNTYTIPDTLEWAQSCYWRIDEVSDTGTIKTGKIWNFTVADYLIVEDFESYNDIALGENGSNLVYVTWVDGYDNPSINGSTMGYVEAFQPSMEFDIVHGNYQSAPFTYDNTTASYSEITAGTGGLTIGTDWTRDDVQVLTLWFYGDPNNAVTEQLYVKLNGVKVTYDGDSANLATAAWTQWNIDLSAFGVNLSNVTEVTIGVERIGASAGTGLLLLDDIRLYKVAPVTD